LGPINDKEQGMKGFKVLPVLCSAAVLIAGCALPSSEDLIMTRDGNTGISYITDYDLQSYVPIPKTGEGPVTLVNNRGDLEVTVVWKDASGTDIADLPAFAANTVYKAAIRLTPKGGYAFNSSTPFAYPWGKITTQHDDLRDPTRIVTVTYNNSDDADITFITDYNLQSYVPIPLAGERPASAGRADVTIGVVWEVEQPPTSAAYVPIAGADTYTFEAGAVYRAKISLTANSGYRFINTRNFEYPWGTVTTQPGADADSQARNLSAVTYMPARAAAVITDRNLTPYLPKPISGAAPVISFAGSQYTGTVVWKDAGTQTALAGPFQPGVEYTAEVTLIPALGYSFTGVGQDTFIHNGAQSLSNPADSGAVRIDFSATVSPGTPTVVYDTILTGRIPKPVYYGTGVKSFAGSQYTGTVSWRHTVSQAVLVGSFQPGIEYTAVVTLSAAPGYTFTGVRQNAFSHGDASGTVTNPADSGAVTINFPPIVVPVYSALSFGPYGAEESALKVMLDRSGEDGSVTIELPGGSEVVPPSGVILVADLNSPGNVTIDGHGRVLRLTSPGSFFAVGNGVTLTLKNITLEGYNANIAPLVEVLSRGRLILDEGVTLTENQTAGRIGGAWVNGGELVINDGAVIKKMKVTTVNAFSSSSAKGGGVLIDNRGKLTMNGGIIGGEDPGDGNTVSTAQDSGGGVLVLDGSFDMYGGTIQSNKAADPWSGGGVYNNGAFTMYGGVIQKNTAQGTSSGGGILNNGTFNMNSGIIQENIAAVDSSGGGVLNKGTAFTMNDGTIKKNEVQGTYSGGGVYHSSGTFIMNAGIIAGNRVLGTSENLSGGGVKTEAQFTMYGGTIGGENPADANTASSGANGVHVGGGFTMSGGIITGNTEGTNNYGVYVDSSRYNSNVGTFTIRGSARVAANNTVYLIKNHNDRPTITIDGDLIAPLAANIEINSPMAGDKVLRALSAELITDNLDKFKYDGQSERIVSAPGPDAGFYYGVYQ
jgi:hypothetical protein